jgi:hypothetical protein
MIKFKNPSQHTTPHTGGTIGASAAARRRRVSYPRDRMATPQEKALFGQTKLCLFDCLFLCWSLILAPIFTALACILILRINLILG